MDYRKFLDLLEKMAKPYPHIKIPKYVGIEESAVDRIPDSFINLLDSVLPVLHAISNKFFHPDTQDMVLFGIQPVAEMYTTKENDKHYCCTLDYYLVSKNTELNKNSHTNTETLIIDFTTGAILSGPDYCASLVSQTQPTTPTYGSIPSERLQSAWTEIKYNQNHFDPAISEVKQAYLPTYIKYLDNNPKPTLSRPYLAAVLMFHQPKPKADIRHEAPSDSSAAKLRRPNRLTKSGDEDISHTRLFFSSSL